jgi:lipopolysaccharide export system protein LptC
MNSITPLRSGNRHLVGEGMSRPRRAPSTAAIARRRWLVRWTKRLLPVLALALLAAMVLWPDIDRQSDAERIAYRRATQTETQGGLMLDARYRGLDQKGRPYMVTAVQAKQVSPERINLVTPKGDATLENGTWVMLQSKKGVYMQHLGQLDLFGDVYLYRADGTTLTTSAATADLKVGAAAGNQWTHAEGPFGVLDAQGFALVDKGNVIQFTGPAKLVINGGH